MKKYNSLKEFFDEQKLDENSIYTDGALVNPNKFPIRYFKCEGAILFADLPRFTKFCEENDYTNIIKHINKFFAWFEAERKFEGIVDKYIGDEVMLVFPSKIYTNPLESALLAAKLMIDNDSWDYESHIGIAFGEFALGEIGTIQRNDVSVIGHTINLAARCASEAKENNIKIVTSDIQLIKKIFNDINDWEIEGPNKEKFKNIEEVDVINIRFKVTRFLFNNNDFKKIE